jgi:hypothetical protein
VAFGDDVPPVCGEAVERLARAGWPADLEAVDTSGGAEAEVEDGRVLGEESAAAADFFHPREAARRDADTRPDAVAVGLSAAQLDLDAASGAREVVPPDANLRRSAALQR